MQTSGLPTRTPTPFANSGAKNTIPVASQIAITPGAASYTDGFPPLTRTPIAAGGVPPFGVDFNGILNAITSAIRWSNAGGQYSYDATFSTAVGGYPKGAILARTGFDGFWVSTVENNTTNPDAAGAGWNMLSAQGWDYVVGAGSANIYTATYIPAILALKDGLTLHSTAVAANTGASTFSPNGLTAKPILSLGQVALLGGELVVNSRFSVRYSATLDSWILLSASGGNAMSGRLINVQVFTASGTYTPTPGTLTAVVDCQSGGGGGGGCQVTAASQYAAGGGGGGGSLARGRFTLSQLGSSVAVGIGTAGAGGIGNANGSVGGTTTFGALLSAPGGRGGAPGLAVASTAQIVVAGASASVAATGGNVFNTGGTPGGVGMTYLTSASSGNGGGSPITGGGGGGAAVGLTSAGQAATAPGAGGGGPASGPSTAAQNGGAGGAGMVIVWEYA